MKTSCPKCGISDDIINMQSFSCFEESSSFVTYRARLEGTSERDSDSLISLIEDWVRGGGASVIVTGILMTVDPHCSVAISSLSEPECSTNVSPTRKADNNITVFVGVTIVFIAIIAILIAVIAALVFRNHQLTGKIKKLAYMTHPILHPFLIFAREAKFLPSLPGLRCRYFLVGLPPSLLPATLHMVSSRKGQLGLIARDQSWGGRKV